MEDTLIEQIPQQAIEPAINTQAWKDLRKQSRAADAKLKPHVDKKIDLFAEEYIKTGGNATEAAIRVFNCKDRVSAGAVGYEYKKKIQYLTQMLMESKGYTLGKMIDKAYEKFEDSKSPDWFDRLMDLGGHPSALNKSNANNIGVVNIVQKQSEILSKYSDEAGTAEGEIINDE